MLRKVNLELTVLDYDRIGGSDPIGKVLLGYNRKKLEKKHWVEMVDNPRRPVIHWHVLQDPEPDEEDAPHLFGRVFAFFTALIFGFLLVEIFFAILKD